MIHSCDLLIYLHVLYAPVVMVNASQLSSWHGYSCIGWLFLYGMVIPMWDGYSHVEWLFPCGGVIPMWGGYTCAGMVIPMNTNLPLYVAITLMT